ncbi:MAG TPA: insulinase family protein [Deltaproteobacteria bacterium]|nr:insulinase family protein [Deltaproteobacteria bacterium]
MKGAGPSVNKTTLNNGIRILTKKMPHARSVVMGVWVNVGARDEADSENGISHFIEHMIFKGTKKRTGYQIAKEFDAIGGLTNAYTSMEHTCYHAKVLDTHLPIMVDILSDIFLNSQFQERDVQTERPVILQEIGMVEDAPDEFIHLLAGNGLWGDNPLGRSILGTRENILTFNANKIREFFHRLYIPDRIVISAAGNLEHQQMVDLIGPAFEAALWGDRFPQRSTPETRSLVGLHHRELEQVHICMATRGMSITDPRRYACSLMNTILGGNMSSRLFQEIREKRGLAYAVYSFISSHIDTGMFGIYAGVGPEKTHECIELILKELRRLKTTGVESSELHGAKEYTKGNLLLASESVDNQMARLAQNEIHMGRYVPLKEIVDNIESVKAEDIMELAQTLFLDGQLVLTMLGPVSDKASYEKLLSL